MAQILAIIEAFDHVDFGGYGRGAEAFPGIGSQARVDATKPEVTRKVFSATPDMTAAASTRYIRVQAMSLYWLLVYAGPATVSDAEKQAKAVLIPSIGNGLAPSRMLTVEPGHVVHVWDHPGIA